MNCERCDHGHCAYDENGTLIDSYCASVDEEGNDVCHFSMKNASPYMRAYFLMEIGEISPKICEFIQKGDRLVQL